MSRKLAEALRLAALAAALGLSACSAPEVPHAIVSRTDESCRGCHASGARGATQSPHASRDGCLACHE